MNFIKTQYMRFKLALRQSSFWFVLILIIPMSMLGIWWPVFYEWKGYSSYLMPASWFTFGLGSLAVLSLEKMFSPEKNDNYKKANSIIIVALSIIGCLFYGKALLCDLNGKPLTIIEFSGRDFCSLNVLELAIFLNILVWIWHLISKIEYDDSKPFNALGDNYDAK